MKISTLMMAMLLALTPSAFAKSPSSEGVSADVFFTGAANDNGRDSGWHTGWCKAPGHPESQGQGQANASGHRNHDHCDDEEPPEDEG